MGPKKRNTVKFTSRTSRRHAHAFKKSCSEFLKRKPRSSQKSNASQCTIDQNKYSNLNNEKQQAVKSNTTNDFSDTSSNDNSKLNLTFLVPLQLSPSAKKSTSNAISASRLDGSYASLVCKHYCDDQSNDCSADVRNCQQEIQLEGKKSNFSEDLARWALINKVSQSTVTDLLLVSRSHFPDLNLSKTARTLLHTPRHADVFPMGSGKYFYFGVNLGIIDFLKYEWSGDILHLKIQISTDGLPISNSTTDQLWPLIGRCTVSNVVFLIACYWGKSKPSCANEYFQPFVDEITPLTNNGLVYEGKQISISLHSLVCDIPAKSFALMTKGHTGYSSCSKCVVEGDYIDSRMCFLETDCTKRTNESLCNVEDTEYRRGKSVLLSIPGFGLVSGVPLDPMHLLSQGVMKKLLTLWDKGLKSVRLFTKKNLSLLTQYLTLIGSCIPMEFGRKVTDIDKWGHWKATQFRLFLVYVGIVALRIILPSHHELMIHFTKICIATQLLCLAENINFARSLMKEFVTDFARLYGKANVSTCIHGLIHISDDVANLGPLDTMSAYPFENFLRHLKKTKHSTVNPLEQLYNTYTERNLEQKLPNLTASV